MTIPRGSKWRDECGRIWRVMENRGELIRVRPDYPPPDRRTAFRAFMAYQQEINALWHHSNFGTRDGGNLARVS